MIEDVPVPLPKTSNLGDPYMAGGDRVYVVGSQDGSFPDAGWHVPGEMHGVWAHPIKLLDGFWLEVDHSWLEHAGRFISGPFWTRQVYECSNGVRVDRTQFAPDGEPVLVVRYVLQSLDTRRVRCRLLARTDLRAVWDPVTVCEDTADVATYNCGLDAWCCENVGIGGWVVVGIAGARSVAHAVDPEHWGPERCAGRGVSVTLEYDMTLRAGQPVSFDLLVSGSDRGRDEAEAAFKRVAASVSTLWETKAGRYAKMLGASVLDVPDPSIQDAWDWIKCNYDWLVRDVPGLGRGLGAGVPEYPWWFGCDNAYALLGCLALGQREIALTTLDFLRDMSIVANGSTGRMIHECTTSGHVTDAGRASETAQFVATAWQACLWTGDADFLARTYDFCRRGLLEWTLREHTSDDDPLPVGYGMVEIEGLDTQCVDVAASAASALLALAGMANLVGDGDTEREALHRATELCVRLQEAFWIEVDGLYGDVVASPRHMIAVLDRWQAREMSQETPSTMVPALTRLREEAMSDPEPDQPRAWLLKNWTHIAPLETEIAGRDRALRVLERVQTPEFVGQWGMYVNAFAGGDCMSITAGALIVAELAYGRVDRAAAYVRAVTDTLVQGMPGAIAEILPDRGCFVQAWSGYAVAWPVVTGIFGIRPDAFRRRLFIAPQFPSLWPTAELHALPIGNARCDVEWTGDVLRVRISDAAWHVELAERNSGARLLWEPVDVVAAPGGGRDWTYQPCQPLNREVAPA